MFEVRQEDDRQFPLSIYISFIGINSEFQDKGYGTSVLKVFLKAFSNDQEWKFNNYVLTVESNNHRARHVYKKLGFQEIIETTPTKSIYMWAERSKFID